ncbi:hypothetical protein CR513_13953, partial [Mucuna pruriens]
MKHPTEDHSLFGIYMIEELVEEYFQLGNCNEEMKDFVGIAESSSCSKADYDEVQEFPDSKDKSDKEGRDQLKTKFNSTETISNKADPRGESKSARVNQTRQLNAPPGSDSEAEKEVETDSSTQL